MDNGPVHTNRNLRPSGTRAGGKRAYVKPAFRFERVFETKALACGKISSTQAQCKSLLKNS